MKKNYILMIIALGLFSSCDDRLKTLEALNSAPKVLYYNSSNKLVANIIDSVRLMPSGLTVYNLKLKLSDDNYNIQFLDLIKTVGDYEISYQNNELKAPTSIRTDAENLVLNIYPSKLGTISASFKISDKFGANSVSNMNLFVFDNLVPIAILAAKKISGNEYLLDGSSSYDKDKNFDGKIVKYIFLVNGVEYPTDKPTLNHFLLPGENNVGLRVMDNSTTLSEIVLLKIDNK